MMETQRITLWCQLVGKRAEVVLSKEPQAAHHPAIPEGWGVQSCLGRDTDCYNKGCPFTVEEDVQDSMRWPFTASQRRGSFHSERRIGAAEKWVPVIDSDRCTGCNRCVEACGPKSLELVDGIAALARPDTCGSEEHCIAPCQDDAIHMAWVSMDGDRSTGKWRSEMV